MNNEPTFNGCCMNSCIRTYHQVEKWCGIKKSLGVWGRTPIFFPTTMTKQPAPKKLLNLIFYSCEVGLKCALICRF